MVRFVPDRESLRQAVTLAIIRGMKKLLLASCMFLCLGVSGFAQGGFGGDGSTDDHTDSAPIQSGYAVITPASPTADLTVLETFGLKDGTETRQAGFPAPVLVTSATMFVDVNSRLARDVGVALVNPSSGSASVTLTLRRNDGTIIGTNTITIQGRQQTAQFVTALVPVAPSSGGGGIGGPPTEPSVEYTGTLGITSTSPIAVIGLRFRSTSFSTLPVTNVGGTSSDMPIISSGVGGSSAFILSHFVTGGGWESQIVLRNSSSSALTVRVDLFKQDGTALTARLNRTSGSSFINLTVPANGVLVLSPRDANGDDRF
jgi:hypothetical protein